MPLSGIPVKMFGVTVGTAQILDDGTVDMTIEGPCEIGKELLRRLEAGEYNGLHVLPEGVDPDPKRSPDPKDKIKVALDLGFTEQEILASVPESVVLLPAARKTQKLRG